MATKLESKKSLLIIEKDVHTAYLLDFMLSREGYDVISTTNCAIASQLIRKIAPPEMVFLDVALSGENDCKILHEIRTVAGWESVPIVLLAEHYTMDDVKQALSKGATDYIIQPFNHAELLTQIKRHSLKAVH